MLPSFPSTDQEKMHGENGNRLCLTSARVVEIEEIEWEIYPVI